MLEYDREAETTWGGVDITQGVQEIQGVQGPSVRLVAAQKVVGWEPRQRLERAGIQVNTRELYQLNNDSISYSRSLTGSVQPDSRD